jgi:hypothetical protein
MATPNLRWQLIGAVLAIFVSGGCVAPTPISEPPAAAPTSVPSTSTTVPSTPTPVPPTTTPPVEVGDAERGRDIYETGGGVIPIYGCKGCHSLKGYVYQGPSLQGISEIAGDRVPELSAAEYLRQSIVDPSVYLVEGFEDKMRKDYQSLLSEEDIDALVAFLLTQ